MDVHYQCRTFIIKGNFIQMYTKGPTFENTFVLNTSLVNPSTLVEL